jgi:hypothetical protein
VNPAVPVVTTLVCFIISHARLRVRWAPGIPHALINSGRMIRAQLGRIAPRECGAVFAIIARSEATEAIHPSICGATMDCFAEPVIWGRA